MQKVPALTSRLSIKEDCPGHVLIKKLRKLTIHEQLPSLYYDYMVSNQCKCTTNMLQSQVMI